MNTINQKSNLDFKFKFRLSTYDEKENKFRISPVFDGVARNDSESASMNDIPEDIAMRVHFAYDGRYYKYTLASKEMPICPAISRCFKETMTAIYANSSKDCYSFYLDENLFEHPNADEPGCYNILIWDTDFRYLEDIGCFIGADEFPKDCKEGK